MFLDKELLEIDVGVGGHSNYQSQLQEYQIGESAVERVYILVILLLTLLVIILAINQICQCPIDVFSPPLEQTEMPCRGCSILRLISLSCILALLVSLL